MTKWLDVPLIAAVVIVGAGVYSWARRNSFARTFRVPRHPAGKHPTRRTIKRKLHTRLPK